MPCSDGMGDVTVNRYTCRYTHAPADRAERHTHTHKHAHTDNRHTQAHTIGEVASNILERGARMPVCVCERESARARAREIER